MGGIGRRSGGGGAANQNAGASAQAQAIAAVNKTGFTDSSFGQWDLDISGVGGAQILKETDLYGETSYSALVWDGNYSILGNKTYYDSLNSAKSAAKETIKANIQQSTP